LNRHYYSIAINYRKNELEEKMLLNLHKKKWTDGLILKRFDTHSETNEQTVQVTIYLPCPSKYLFFYNGADRIEAFL
jgi:26S proteasome regulatory subunit N11